MYDIYIGKIIGDQNNGFKIRMNKHMIKIRSEVSISKFPACVFSCSQRKNRPLGETLLYIYVTLSLKSNFCLESLESHFIIEALTILVEI